VAQIAMEALGSNAPERAEAQAMPALAFAQPTTRRRLLMQHDRTSLASAACSSRDTRMGDVICQREFASKASAGS
jgi:hypothetical protein